MAIFRSDDIDLFYTESGAGPPVLLLHPFPSSHQFWLPLTERLVSRYRVILPDLRGHGLSGVGEGNATMEKHSADILRLCDHLELRTAAFVGCSLGGYILFECWRRFRERISGLALCTTRATTDTFEQGANREKAAQEVLNRGPECFWDSMLPKLVSETIRRNRPDIIAAVRRTFEQGSAKGIVANLRGMAERPDSLATLSTINVPTVIITGEEDSFGSVEEGDRMRNYIKNCDVTKIPHAGHYAPFEQPHEVARLLRKFLDDLHTQKARP